jgi:hypothetical protein
MAQQKSDSSQQLINLLLIGLGAYLVWEFILQPLIAQGQESTTATGPVCYDQSGNALYCPAGVAAGTTLCLTSAGYVPCSTGSTAGVVCYDQSGNPVTCPAGVPPGSTVNTGTAQTQTQTQTPTRTQQIQALSQRLTTTSTALAARAAMAANQPARQTTGTQRNTNPNLKGITPAFPSGGGPAFSHFIPGGMTFGQGATPFGSPPQKYPNGWMQ